ncbi:MAG TPA: hypothetical protein VGB13_07755 [Candidatus Krumholzibacteria bacterium]
MIKNFDTIKEQLRELAGIINTFKSEAVQLRLIELVFEAAEAGARGQSGKAEGGEGAVGRRSRRPTRSKPSGPKEKEERSGKTKGGRRPGGKATLERLIGEGFFKKAKTIKQVVEHCDHNLALKYKQSNFSGPLGRLTRDGQLKRTKNADKQYEYSQV